MRSARKYILIPEYAPLYAMRECFGNEHGPLKEPTPTPVDIIGKLLLQSGKEKLTIYEVVKEGKGFSKPVQLTRQNYQLPYEQIAGLVKETTPDNSDNVVLPVDSSDPVEPTIVDTDADKNAPIVPCGEVVQNILDTTADMMKDAVDVEIEHTLADPEVESDTSTEESSEENAEESDLEESSNNDESTAANENSHTDPYAGMSKNQRKKARREEAVRKAAEDALKNMTL